MFQPSRHHNKPVGIAKMVREPVANWDGIHDDHHLKCMNVFLDVASWWPWSVDMVTGCFSNGWLQVLIIFLPRGMRWQSFCLIGTISPTSRSPCILRWIPMVWLDASSGPKRCRICEGMIIYTTWLLGQAFPKESVRQKVPNGFPFFGGWLDYRFSNMPTDGEV